MELTVSTYKPTGTLTYESPGTRRFFTVKGNRLVRLAKRIHDGRLLLPEIVKLVREAADELLHLGGFLLLTDKGSALLTDLAWIKSPTFAPEDLEWDIREKERHRVVEPERCTLCRVKLVWPANIVWRRGLQIVSVSAPIGIQCATREAARKGWGRLHDLITEVRAITTQSKDTAQATANPDEIKTSISPSEVALADEVIAMPPPPPLQTTTLYATATLPFSAGLAHLRKQA